MVPQSPTPVFHLGLCMAGAISAGAYTAGVVDYLIEALDRWEKARNHPDPKVAALTPQHRVVIDVITGASAGGMTGAIALAALQREMDHVTDGQYKNFKGDNKLYEAWVKLTADEMLPGLLANSDLREHGGASVLNSNFIDRIADRILELKDGTKPDRPYIADNLELCLSLTNVTGYRTEVTFGNVLTDINLTQSQREQKGSSNKFIGRTHRDFGHFRLDTDYRDDGRIPVEFSDTNPGLDILKQCTKATGAFPVGLRWRKVVRHRDYINQNPLINPYFRWLDGSPGEKPFKELVGEKDREVEDNHYRCVTVDGGMLNNEPFEVASKIMRWRKVNLDDDARNSEGTILMIDPFPSVETDDSILPDGKIPLRKIIGALYSTMRSELLIKQEDLRRAASMSNYCQFLIAPTREKDGSSDPIIGADAIACGSLDGFGGFLKRTFREHDFQLGRKNCQSFLRNHFLMPDRAENPIINGGYAHLQDLKDFNGFAKPSVVDGNTIYFLPIIPDVDPATGFPKKDREAEPTWPALADETAQEMLRTNADELELRIKKLLGENLDLSGFGFSLLASVASSAIAEKVLPLLYEQLSDHGLVE